MQVVDKVYGQQKIDEKVLIELIKSRPLQRLKGINQAGSQLVFPSLTTTRYDHCVGVMLLLKIKGASYEEQIAGLLHDVPHTAFSHAIDFVFDNGLKADYHERFLKKVVFNSEIPTLLKKYGFDPNHVTDEHNFSLLEQDLPALCADRIDYSLRDAITLKLIKQKDVQRFLDAIVVYKEKFVMTDKKIALEFSRNYLYLSETSWISAKTLAAFNLIAEAIKIALEEKAISHEDLFTTDEFVIKKLISSTNPKIAKNLSLLTPKLKVKETRKDFDFHSIGKVRFIDPPILVGGKLIKLSKLDGGFSKEIESFKSRMKNGRYIKIQKNVNRIVLRPFTS